MWLNLLILGGSLFLLIKGATLATKYAAGIAKSFRLSKYVVGFIIVAVISVLPEALVSMNSAINGTPEFGLGTLFGSNVADLTLVFFIIVYISGRGIKVESKILKNNIIYPFILLIPIILGMDGFYSRVEGVGLLLIGSIFYFLAIRGGMAEEAEMEVDKKDKQKNIAFLLLSMLILLVGAHFAVDSATKLAEGVGINMILFGMFTIGLGTTIPELLFSLKSIQKDDDSLAVGDILGTVLADGTIIVGILAIISPFSFPVKIVYVTGVFMVIASFLLFYFMRSGKTLTKKEAFLLLVFWVLFALVEISFN